MRKLDSHKLGIEQGETVLFSDFENGGPMWSGDGQRDVSVPIVFSESFDMPPSVMVTLALCDMSNEAYMRMDLRAKNVTTRGFDIAFATWGDTKFARVRAAWQGIGAVSSEDTWDI